MKGWKKLKNRLHDTIENQILEINEKPHKVALGCAFGIGINFFPTLGIGFVFAFAIAVFFKANRASATITSLTTSPFIPIMYALNLVVGGFILTPAAGQDNIVEFVISQYSTIIKLGNIQQKIFGFLDFFGSTFLLGAAVNATLSGLALYFLIKHILKKRQIT